MYKICSDGRQIGCKDGNSCEDCWNRTDVNRMVAIPYDLVHKAIPQLLQLIVNKNTNGTAVGVLLDLLIEEDQK